MKDFTIWSVWKDLRGGTHHLYHTRPRAESGGKRKELKQRAAQSVTYQLGKEVLTHTIRDQYHKLADVVTKPQYRYLIDNARQASWSIGQIMHAIPMRAGGDGFQLSFRGFPRYTKPQTQS